jgi:hypothetical protein
MIKYFPSFFKNNIFFLKDLRFIDPESDQYKNLEINTQDNERI